MKSCRHCVAPKRHPGCHATCEEYLKEKDELNARNKTIFDAKTKAGLVYEIYKKHSKGNH